MLNGSLTSDPSMVKFINSRMFLFKPKKASKNVFNMVDVLATEKLFEHRRTKYAQTLTPI